MTHTLEQLQAARDAINVWKMNCGLASQYHIENSDYDSYIVCKETNEHYDVILSILDEAVSKMETVEFDWERDIEILKTYVFTNEVETKRLDRLSQLIKSLKGQ